MDDYPKAIVTPGHIEPVPRRIRAVLGGEVVFDTTQALYVWEWPNYPQYYIPIADVNADAARRRAAQPAAPPRDGAAVRACGSATSRGPAAARVYTDRRPTG